MRSAWYGDVVVWVAFTFCVFSIQIFTTSRSSAVPPRTAASTMCSGRPIPGSSTGSSSPEFSTSLSRSVISTYEISLALVDYSGSSAPLSTWRLLL